MQCGIKIHIIRYYFQPLSQEKTFKMITVNAHVSMKKLTLSNIASGIINISLWGKQLSDFNMINLDDMNILSHTQKILNKVNIFTI